MKKIPIVFSIDHNYVMQAGVCILSLLNSSNEEEFYNIYILGANDITNEDKNLLQQIIQVYYAQITFITIDDRFDNVFETRGVSKSTYFRLMIPDLLPSYDKIIYSDVDVIFQSGLGDVLNIDLGNNYLGGIKAIGAENIKDYIKSLGLQVDKYINAGFLLINASLQRKDNLFNEFKRHLNKQYQFQDQDIINIVCKNRLTFLPLKYCFTQKSYELYYTNPKRLFSVFSPKEVEEAFTEGIIHYEGTNKPWNGFCYRYDNWWRYYKKSVFYSEEMHFQTAYKIQYPTWTLKKILRLLRNFIRGDYKQ